MADNKTTMTPSTSTKFNKAVERATGAAAGSTGDDVKGGALAQMPTEAASLFSAWTPEDMQAKASSGEYEFAPQLAAIKRGQQITALLEGEGPGNDFVDEKTGEVRHVKSWIMVEPRSGIRISILSSSQLDKKLPPFVGTVVTVARAIEDIELKGGHRCADYMVCGPKLPSGKARVFSMLPEKPAQNALPAGEVIEATQAPATGSNGATVS